MTKQLALALALLLLVTPAVFADDAAPMQGAGEEKALSVFTYQFKHKEAEKAASAIKTLVSAEGTVSIQPSSNSIVITDRAENLKNISAALQKYDTPPQPVKLSVRLATAARVQGEGAIPESLKDIGPKLAVMRYNSLESLGAANIESREGQPGLVELSAGYRADFRLGEFDPATDTIQLADFKLSKLQGDQLAQIYKTTLNLKVGQTLIFGATRDPQSNRALIVVITAKR
ncbi:MAG TPA: secretin N-terminal domain-containing protein [Thermoanaerobaculia bacterium]